jgi:hypothetical protein
MTISKAIIPFLLLILISCTENEETETEKNNLTFTIENLSDEEYPDNPDIGFRAKDYRSNWFTDGEIKVHPQNDLYLDFKFYGQNKESIGLKNINISEFIPTIPKNVKKDEYLSYISCINQEWNRNQVKFEQNEFQTTEKKIVRVDLARNCLNSYLWEIICYVNENGKTVPYAYGWFNFPTELYAELFEQKNEIPYNLFKKGMENWKDPASYTVKLDLLRTIKSRQTITFADSSFAMYPLAGARLKKRKEIIYPEKFETMKDLQNDSTRFATFSSPGFYNKKDPRSTELGRIYNLKNVEVSKTTNTVAKGEFSEITLTFRDRNNDREIKLIIGGLRFSDFPVLNSALANEGWKNSMGIGNHTFYESYKEHNLMHAETNPYYALFTDGKNKWLDSHKIGVDGPIFYFSDEERKTLHVWLLSFERHALVGHYVISFE